MGKHGHCTNGLSRTYRSWEAMKRRCDNPKDHHYKNYGGRGIRYDVRWLLFENFLEDMGDKPEGMTLDRIDTNRGYCKENCKWSDKSTQSRNKRNNRVLTFNGKSYCLWEWAELIGMNPSTLRSRLNRGWTVSKALTTPVRDR